MNPSFPLLEAQETLLHPLLQGHFQTASQHQQAIELQDPSQNQALRTWLKMSLNQSASEDDLVCLPIEQAARWQGWLAYYRGDYHNAWQYFRTGWQAIQPAINAASREKNLPHVAVELAIGLGKVYTRTGHWKTARSWLLFALAHARRLDRLFDCVRCYGAVGELLMRAGHARAALFCLGTAYHLLPPGSGDRSRQLNYLASALLRLCNTRDQHTAESLLMRSFYLALDSNDSTSICHALARLQFLTLDKNENQDTVLQLSVQPLIDSIKDQPNAANAIPLGFLAIGQTLAAWRRNETHTAQQRITEATIHLRKHESEYRWAQAICFSLGLSNLPPAEFSSSMSVNLDTPPESSNAIDQLWQSLPLQDLGIEHFTPPSEMEMLLTHRKVFFL